MAWGMSRLARIVMGIERILPERTRWHRRRASRLSHGGAFKLLVQTMLSHQTSMSAEDEAIARLWRRFCSPAALAAAPVAQVDRLIRNVNYHPTKARRIITVARIVRDRWSGDLTFLRRFRTDEAMAAFTSLPGVGTKTASVVLLLGFHRPLMPVDTNVSRVAKALGLAGPHDAPDTIAEKLSRMLPSTPTAMARVHNGLLALGQATQRHRNPYLIRRLKAIR